MRKFWQRGLVLLTALTLLVLTGCGGNEQPGPTNGLEQEKPTKLVYGIEPGFAPFEVMGEDGQLEGFDIDLINAIGEVAGVEFEPKLMEFGVIVPSLETATIDCAIAAISIDEERKQSVNFSVPYYKSGLSVAVRADNNEIKGFEDLEGRSIGVQTGTTGMKEAEAMPGAQVKAYDRIDTAYMALESGAIDAVVNDLPVTAYYIAQGKDNVKIVGDIRSSEFYGIAVPKQNTETLELINTALAQLKESGEYAVIYKKWFSEDPPEYLPGEPQDN